MKKKLLALLLALTMCLCFASCGGSDDATSDDTSSDTATEQTDETIDTSDDTPTTITPNPISDDESEASYDIGLSVKKSFGMSATLKKVSYDDLSSIGSKLESMLESGLSKSGITDFTISFNDYEDDDSDGIDQLAYVAAFEDDDMEKATVEMGAYHSTTDGNYYQYNAYTSETLDSSTASVKSILSEIKSAYGVSLSESKVAAALKEAWTQAESNEDYYSLYEQAEFAGDGYTDYVTASVDVGYDEEGNMSAYIYVDRERLYS
jgi:hypothetical protein